MGDNVLGMDVSKWQGTMNFETARDAGAKFVFIKASEASGYRDPQFITNCTKAKAAGLLVGAYHYFHATKAQEQATNFMGAVGDVKLDFPLAVDCEARDGVDSDVVTSVLQNLTKILEEKSGKAPMIYTSSGWWNEYALPWSKWKNYPLWVANWKVKSPALPRDWKEWKFWQWLGGSNGRGAEFGASGSKSIDLNYFNGTHEELLAFCSKGESVIVPPIEPPSTSPTLEQRVTKIETAAIAHGWSL